MENMQRAIWMRDEDDTPSPKTDQPYTFHPTAFNLFPKCQKEMRIVSLIDDKAVIERILRHLGLWNEGVRVASGPDPRAIGSANLVSMMSPPRAVA